MCYSRIVIIGSPGAGKTTLAQLLGMILGIPVFHLDRWFWKEGWKELTRPERIAIQQQIMTNNNKWIIEGSYLGTSDDRLNAADTIIFLDTFFLLCLLRVLLRHLRMARQPRIDIPQGCSDRISLLTTAKIFYFPLKHRRQLRSKLATFENLRPEMNIHILRSQKDIKELLLLLPQKRLQPLEELPMDNVHQAAFAPLRV